MKTPNPFKVGDAVTWRASRGMIFPGEVKVAGKSESYVLFPTIDHPTGGHWIDNSDLEFAACSEADHG